MDEVKDGDVLQLDETDKVAHVVGSSEDKRQSSWKQFWINKAGGLL